MAREGKVGILIEVKDQFSGALKKVGSGLGKTGKAAKDLGAKMKKTFDQMKFDIISVNQALELGRKAWEILRGAIAGTIGRTLELREATDPLKKQWESFATNVEDAAATIGDVLLPVVVSLATAMDPLVDKFKDWLKQNKKLIQSKLLRFITSSSIAIVKMAKAVNTLRKAWTGLHFAKAVIQQLWDKDQEKSVRLQNQLLKEINTIDAETAALGRLEKGIVKIAEETDKKIKEGLEDPMDRARSAAEKAARAIRAARDAATGRELDAAMVRFNEEVELQEEMDFAVERLLNLKAKPFKKKDSPAAEKQAQALMTSAEQLQMIAGSMNEILGQFSSLFSLFGGADASGDLSAGLREGGFLGAAKAVWGAIFSPAKALLGFSHGGLVTGGVPGRDSVPAMLTPGEVVIPAPVVESVRRGSPTPRGGGGAANILAFASSGAEIAKIERDYWARGRDRLKRNRSL